MNKKTRNQFIPGALFSISSVAVDIGAAGDYHTSLGEWDRGTIVMVLSMPEDHVLGDDRVFEVLGISTHGIGWIHCEYLRPV